jgi:ribose transport system ATP-binding protein
MSIDEIQGTGPSAVPALKVEQLSKTFGGTRALRKLDLRITAGEIHAVAGANGSGKSSLIKILSGYHHPDAGGYVEVAGESLRFGSPESSYALGCRFVQQDLGLVDDATVADNLCANGGYPTRLGTVRGRVLRRATSAMLAQVGLDIDPMTPVAALTPSMKTGVAVARAMREDAASPTRLLVLDEPTSALPDDEVQILLDIIRKAAARNVAVLYVTHRLDELFELGCQVTILRDGNLVGSFATKDVTSRYLIEAITGTEVDEPTRSVAVLSARSEKRPVLSVERLTCRPVRDLSFDVHVGEVVGIGGVSGSGREVLLGAIFGATLTQSGRVRVDGAIIPQMRPDKAIAEGMAFLPADRKVSSGLLSLSARENLTLPDLGAFWRSGWFRGADEKREAQKWFEQLSVSPAGGIEQPLTSFSGGNQQKVLLAKWLRCRPKLLLMDEPTQGVDVGVRAQVHRRLLDAVADGATLVVSSTDLEELEILCDRVLIMRGGRIAGELTGREISVGNISRWCLDRQPAVNEHRIDAQP